MTTNTSGVDRQLRDALGSFATGVTIVTATGSDGIDAGLTANSFNSVSLDPPMVLWSLARNSKSLPIFEEASHFNVHILATDQQTLSDHFAHRGEDKFNGLSFTRGVSGAPRFDNCSARFECRTVFRYDGGDHVIFVGEVEHYEAGEKPPLAYHGGKYAFVVRRPGPIPETLDGNLNQRDIIPYLLSATFHQTFLKVRTSFQKHGLTEDEYYTLNIISTSGQREPSRLRALLASGGRDASGVTEDTLHEKGLIETRIENDKPFLVPTEQGQALALEFLTTTKATEAQILGGLEEGEAVFLRQILQRILQIQIKPD